MVVSARNIICICYGLFHHLFVLKQLEISNAWDVLFTGSGYFTKTKIFGTVAEANAPDRGQLFAQLSPIVLVLALTMGFYAIYSTFRNKNQSHLFFGVWIFTGLHVVDGCEVYVQRNTSCRCAWSLGYRHYGTRLIGMA